MSKRVDKRPIWGALCIVPLIHLTLWRGAYGDIYERVAGAPEKDLFTSNEALVELFSREADIRQQVEAYVQRLDNQISVMDNFIRDYYHSTNESEEEAVDYVSNPINAYVLLKRAGIKWPQLANGILNQTFDDQTREIETVLRGLPHPSDLEGASNGIFLLQETYDLDIKDFAEGIIKSPQTGTAIRSDKHLSSADMELLGKLAFNRGFYDRATEWMDGAIWMAKKRNSSTPDRVKTLQGILKTMQNKHDIVLEKKGARDKDWRTFLVPFDEKLRKKKKYKKIKSKKYQAPDTTNLQNREDHNLWEKFNALCRGELKKSPNELKDLKCHYLHYNEPFLRLGPFKLEQLSLSPFIAVFHEFMFEQEMSDFRANAAKRLLRSMHVTRKGDHDGISVKRTSSQAWLDEIEYNETTGEEIGYTIKSAWKLSTRLARATKFQVLSGQGGEPFQVANYGIGGVYNHHTDSSGELGLSPNQIDGLRHIGGDRIATSMAYLSDVRAGGATVFPNAKVTIWPQKGNLAFWYNNDKNGNTDLATFHGGCPVLAGSKWITNKWIRSWAQFKKFPCHVDVTQLHRHHPINNDWCKMSRRCDSK